MTDPRTDLEDVIEAIAKIDRYTEGMTFETFAEDDKTVDAVLRNFEVLGEAAKNVPEGIRAGYSEVPWAEMAGMRDKLIHGYATVDLEIVWTTIETDLPEIHPELRSIVAELDADADERVSSNESD